MIPKSPATSPNDLILLGTDFSLASKQALLWATENVLMDNDKVLIFHSLNPNFDEIEAKDGVQVIKPHDFAIDGTPASPLVPLPKTAKATLASILTT
jgi:hypothetical protein